MTDNAPIDSKSILISRGLRFPKDGNVVRGQIRGSLRDGTYEAKEAQAVLRVVRDGDRVLELGGGIGFMSTWIAKNRNVASIDVFEANPHLVPFIENVHALNEVINARVHNAILGDSPGQAKFYIRKKLIASSLDRDAAEGIVETVDVPVRRTSDIMDEIAPTVLVCDIEGAELDLIPQMDLTGLRAAVIETHPQWIGPEGMNTVFRAFMDGGLAYWARGSSGKVICFRRNWPLR